MPFSTDSHGRYLSHVVSAGSGSKVDAAGSDAPSSASGSRRRVARGAPEMPAVTSAAGQHLFFNVTVFGKELHLRLRANRRLVAPGAFVEWQEDFAEKAKERIHGDCVFTGDVSDMPEASVAISNCDGLVSHQRMLGIFAQWSERCSLSGLPERHLVNKQAHVDPGPDGFSTVTSGCLKIHALRAVERKMTCII